MKSLNAAMSAYNAYKYEIMISINSFSFAPSGSASKFSRSTLKIQGFKFHTHTVIVPGVL